MPVRKGRGTGGITLQNLEMVGEGATTKIYRDGDRAIKFYENAPPNEAENEAKRQAFAYGAGLPVPAVYGVRHLDSRRTMLDMAYIPGAPLIRERMDETERKNAIYRLAELQSMVHRVEADGLPGQAERLRGKIESTPYLGRTIRERLLGLLNDLDSGEKRLCHGDFHPLNILFDGKKHWIIDWVDATAGSPLADACRSYLIIRQHFSGLAELYLEAFCGETGVRREEVLAWLTVIAGGRLGENMDEKARAFLLEIAEER